MLLKEYNRLLFYKKIYLIFFAINSKKFKSSRLENTKKIQKKIKDNITKDVRNLFNGNR